MRIQASTCLGGDIKRLMTIFAQPRQQALAVPVTVDAGGVEEIYAAVQRTMQRPGFWRSTGPSGL
jgi:hypothetical protein